MQCLNHGLANGLQCPVARVLVQDAGADVGARMKNGRTPLHAAARNGHGEMMHLLIKELRASPSVMCYDSKSPADDARANGHEALANALNALCEVR